MENNTKPNTGILVMAIVITAIVVGGGVYLWQNNKTAQPTTKQEVINETINTESIEPLTYSISGISASISKITTSFDYTTQQLKEMADECGSQYNNTHFDELISKFSGASKTIYNFKYTGESQEPNTFVVTLVPNKINYTSLEQFKKDFNICAAGGDMYPTMMNNNWLLFTSSCGSGFDDGSGLPVGCQKIKDTVESTLKLN